MQLALQNFHGDAILSMVQFTHCSVFHLYKFAVTKRGIERKRSRCKKLPQKCTRSAKTLVNVFNVGTKTLQCTCVNHLKINYKIVLKAGTPV